MWALFGTLASSVVTWFRLKNLKLNSLEFPSFSIQLCNRTSCPSNTNIACQSVDAPSPSNIISNSDSCCSEALSTHRNTLWFLGHGQLAELELGKLHSTDLSAVLLRTDYSAQVHAFNFPHYCSISLLSDYVSAQNILDPNERCFCTTAMSKAILRPRQHPRTHLQLSITMSLFVYQPISLHRFWHFPATTPDTHSTVAYNIWYQDHV